MDATNRTIALLPPLPEHRPAPARERILLYPLWALRIEVRTSWFAPRREVLFSVDGVRGIPLPIPRWPEVVTQEIPSPEHVLDPLPRETAVRTTLHFIRKGLGSAGALFARVRAVDAMPLYKLYWVARDDTGAEILVDSRSGARVPLASIPLRR